MTQKTAIWNQDYPITSFLVNPQRRLGLFALLNLLQDVAGIHASHLGFGYETMNEKKLLWVLTRQKLIMHEWPHWGETIRVQTWPRPYEGIYAHRDFVLFVGDKKVGECATGWIALDYDTRRPKKGDFSKLMSLEPVEQLAFDAPKIPLQKDLEAITRFEVRNSDIDVNQHVNNTRYAQWILDSIPLEWHFKFSLQEYEVNFLAESHLGDVITILKGKRDTDSWLQFQGLRESDQKVVFSARLLVQERPR